MGQNVVGRWQANARDLRIECVSLALIKHCLYLFLCMAVRQCYGKRRRDLELGLTDGQPQKFVWY